MTPRVLLPLAIVLAAAFVARADDKAHEPGGELVDPPPPPKHPPVVSGPAKPTPKAGTTRPIVLPKALPTDRDELIHGALEKVPPFFGVFGPQELLEHTGFKSRPGDWVSFQVVSRSDATKVLSTLRVSHVLPAVDGGAWIEIDGDSTDAGEVTTRLLTKGRGNGNVYRALMRTGGLPLIELPLASVSIAPDDLAALYAEPAALTLVGRETVTVPLGKFACDHWRVQLAGRTLEFFVADDRSVPFNRVVKMDVVEGVALAVGRGTDAVAKLPAPRLPE